MPQIQVIATGVLITVSEAPQWVDGIWECGSQRFTDPTQTLYEIPPASSAFVPGSMLMSQFLSSIASFERAALRAHTDPLVKEFVTMCDDPRFTEINTALPGIQFDVNYAAGVVPAPTGAANAGAFIVSPPIAGAARAEQILAGNLLAVGS